MSHECNVVQEVYVQYTKTQPSRRLFRDRLLKITAAIYQAKNLIVFIAVQYLYIIKFFLSVKPCIILYP